MLKKFTKGINEYKGKWLNPDEKAFKFLLLQSNEWLSVVSIMQRADLGMQKCNNFYPTEINIDNEPLVLFGYLILGNSG